MKVYHIYLLRHGLTQGNEKGQYVGRLDMPLSAGGERQLEKLAKDHQYPQAEAYFSSPLSRCVRSMEILYPDVQPLLIDGLAECNFGEYEGKTLDELKGETSYQNWVSGLRSGDSSAAPPAGESSADFQLRTCRAFAQIAERLMRSGTTRAVIMAHGGTIMTILGMFAMPRRPFYQWMAGNGMGYEALLTPQLWMNGRVIEVAGTVPGLPEGEGLAGCGPIISDFSR
ncbi:MAG: histidine phosphatase family protein [Clostridia bacterium]|nr:histidine phosphatase family protein [Clostridia bacterium]